MDLRRARGSQAVVHAFNPSTLGGRQTSEFEASLVYRMSSRTARVTQRNTVSKTKQKMRERERERETD